MSYISTLNQDPSPEVFSEDYVAHELNIWATAPLYFEDTPLSTHLHLPSDSDSDNVKSPASVHAKIPDEYLYPFLPLVFNHDLPFVSPLTEHDASSHKHIVSRPSDSPSTGKEADSKPKSALKKRKSSTDETEKVAHDDDKRRRNTMASARFRQRKKLREAALEQKAKEMTAKVESLEKKVDTLEKEAKWLRSLLVEKDGSLPSEISEQRR